MAFWWFAGYHWVVFDLSIELDPGFTLACLQLIGI